MEWAKRLGEDFDSVPFQSRRGPGSDVGGVEDWIEGYDALGVLFLISDGCAMSFPRKYGWQHGDGKSLIETVT